MREASFARMEPEKLKDFRQKVSAAGKRGHAVRGRKAQASRAPADMRVAGVDGCVGAAGNSAALMCWVGCLSGLAEVGVLRCCACMPQCVTRSPSSPPPQGFAGHPAAAA